MTSVRVIALLTGLLPIIAIHLTYLVSAMQGYVPWCLPYFESCTSISATGRHGASYFIFKGTMLPAAMLLMMFWYLVYQWLKQLGDNAAAAKTIFWLGLLGGLFLIVYAVALGAAGDSMRLQRRIGIILYFTLTYLCQLLLVWRMGRLHIENQTRHWLLGLCVATLSIGLATLVMDMQMEDYDNYEDAFEWILALMVHLYFLVIYRAWGQTGFRVKYVVG
jgi:hypothetical protein